MGKDSAVINTTRPTETAGSSQTAHGTPRLGQHQPISLPRHRVAGLGVERPGIPIIE